jgi:ceramide glucosyltransferase
VIIVAIKGVSDLTPQIPRRRLCNQALSARFACVLAVESPSDPALCARREPAQRASMRGVPVEVVISQACLPIDRAQKVHNLLAALRALRDDDRIIVFADADILPGPQWLAQLVRPVANREAAASTGYRWQLPIDRSWPSLIVAAADLSVATAARSWRWNVCWGGSTAVDRPALDRIDLPAVWERAASDDLTLTAALRAGGLKINAPVHVLVPSPVAYTWKSLFGFARRQYLLVRCYAPRHWLFAGWTVCVPALAAATAVGEIIEGRRWAAGVLVVSVVLLELRMSLRRQIAGLLLPPAAQGAARATVDFGRWAWPVIHLVHTAAFLTSCAGRRFTWSGTSYRLDGRVASVERRCDRA